MRKFTRYLNNCFVFLVLTVFYLIIIGISSFIFRAAILLKYKKFQTTYWQDAESNTQDLKDFKSAY